MEERREEREKGWRGQEGRKRREEMNLILTTRPG